MKYKMNGLEFIKNWFIVKNFTVTERLAVVNASEYIIKTETEKAALFIFNTEKGDIQKWIPKSCLNAYGIVKCEDINGNEDEFLKTNNVMYLQLTTNSVNKYGELITTKHFKLSNGKGLDISENHF